MAFQDWEPSELLALWHLSEMRKAEADGMVSECIWDQEHATS